MTQEERIEFAWQLLLNARQFKMKKEHLARCAQRLAAAYENDTDWTLSDERPLKMPEHFHDNDC